MQPSAFRSKLSQLQSQGRPPHLRRATVRLPLPAMSAVNSSVGGCKEVQTRRGGLSVRLLQAQPSMRCRVATRQAYQERKLGRCQLPSQHQQCRG